jgi:hypothetical protein
MAALGVSHPLIAEDAKPPGGQLMAAPRPNLGIAAQSGQSIHAVLNIARVGLAPQNPYSAAASLRITWL